MTGLKTIINGLKYWTVQQLAKLPQPNLDQNDPTASDYVKGRTHYSEIKYGTVLKETEIVDGYYEFEYDRTFIVGEEYVIKFDGLEYRCIAKQQRENVISLGNYDYLENGEPFIFCFGGGFGYVELMDYDDPHTVEVIGYSQIVKKLDDKYLSDNVYTKYNSGVELLPTSFPFEYTAETFEYLANNIANTTFVFRHYGYTYVSCGDGFVNEDHSDNDKDYVYFSSSEYRQSTDLTKDYCKSIGIVFFRDGTYRYINNSFLGDEFTMCDKKYTTDENDRLVLYTVSIGENGVLTATRQ